MLQAFSQTKTCPRCSEAVAANAVVCPNCRNRFDWEDATARTARAMKSCPRCKEVIRADARACPHCGTDFYTLRMRQFGTALILITVLALLYTCAR